MTAPMPDPAPIAPSGPTWKVELKVIVATVVAFVVGLLITVANDVQTNPGLLGSLPTWLQSIITLILPPLVVYLGGFLAPHTAR